jgi:hypothetical protein
MLGTGLPQIPRFNQLWKRYKITKELTKMGHDVSHTVVCGLLHDMNYSLLANSKTLEETNHIDRGAQFEYIKKAKASLTRNQPIISYQSIQIRHASGLCTAFPRLVRARLASALDVELGAVQQSPSAVHNPSLQSLEKGEHILGWAKAQRLDRWRLHGAKGPLLHREICLHIDVRGLDAFMTEPQGND